MTLAGECAIAEGCSAWKFRVFKDCICTTRDALSFYLGVASILCWGIAEIPQIIVNWRSGNSEGVSLAFILTWSVGDLFNLVGCLMDPVTLPTQFYTAVLYTATTLVLVAQHVWYNWSAGPDAGGAAYPYHLQQDEKEARGSFARERESPLEGLFPTDPTLADGMKIPGVDSRRASEDGRRTHSTSVPAGQRQTSPGSYGGSWRRLTLSTSYGTSPRLRALAVAAVLTGGVQLGSPFWRQPHGGGDFPTRGREGSVVGTSRRLLQAGGELLLLPGLPGNQTALGELGPRLVESGRGRWPARPHAAGRLGGNPTSGDLGDVIGQILGWAMTCIYLTGRLPQIILNFTRGTVEGLSIYMFVFAISGNATYLGSILARSLEWHRIQPNLPWLVDSACCLAMDFFILGQFIYYSAVPKRENSYSYSSHGR